jgi:hypothetical protein
MARTLDVYLHNALVGNLVQDAGGQMVFEYAENWLNAPGAAPLSQSLPLRKKRFNRKECRTLRLKGWLAIAECPKNSKVPLRPSYYVVVIRIRGLIAG